VRKRMRSRAELGLRLVRSHSQHMVTPRLGQIDYHAYRSAGHGGARAPRGKASSEEGARKLPGQAGGATVPETGAARPFVAVGAKNASAACTRKSQLRVKRQDPYH
jgi:hypothetical protein